VALCFRECRDVQWHVVSTNVTLSMLLFMLLPGFMALYCEKCVKYDLHTHFCRGCFFHKIILS